MGKIRRCDSRCHNAKGAKCKCWCGGTFHGTAGNENRETFSMGNYEGRRLIETGKEGWLFINGKRE